MPDYKRMYFQLAAKVADVIDILIEAQQRGEEDDNKKKVQFLILENVEAKQEDNKINE